ncbi:MAG TPA: hypothetical protein PLE99_16190 [Candidatus Thiothrix moscowensis]|uniref:hypothetical protein n=1 Tax=unclassified Thiothrix TaxID=2636184 RepID=UPI0025FA5731|nr:MULTISPECIES: hypothetical protein [unclassified Thiothrix]HRJ54301.1 hypothetical protein [Candidatus Thiothrix moscowensis]HRJ94512.1 hypothetical protein [Candidatus Thiothrix moscowensis]
MTRWWAFFCLAASIIIPFGVLFIYPAGLFGEVFLPSGWQYWVVTSGYWFGMSLLMILVVGIFYEPLGEWLQEK